MRRLTLPLLFALPLSCMADTKAPEVGPGLAVTVAPLGLVGVGEVVWDIEVLDGEGQPVWQRRLTASRYGARGGLSYVGPCNAQAPDHTVRLWVAGLFESAVLEPGEFGAGADVAGSLEYVDPTSAGPLVQAATCVPNGDSPVRFDVAVMRPANQGFFDVAVTFDDIFCSAKFDCCEDSDEDGACAVDGAEDHRLLFDGDGQRASTMVLGFACTAGVGEGGTELFLDPLWLDCTTGEGAFSVDIAVTPGGAPGNQCEVGEDGMSGCPIVTEYGEADADDTLFQVGVYRGVEALESGGQSANKVYWNVALGVKRPTIASCVLRTRGTAARLDGGMANDGVIAPGVVYPVISWDVDLGACTNEALGFGEGAPVRVAYVGASSGAFSYGYSATGGARAFCSSPCVCAGEPLADGTTCDDGMPCTSGDVCTDGVCAGVQACTAAPGECWEAAGACDGGGVCAYVAKASGVGCADDGNPCTVDRCDGNGACEHVAGNAGVVCRSAVGDCDVAEQCDGGVACPADAKVAVGVVCRGAVDGCDVAEVCGGGDECPAPSVSYCGECGAADGVSVLTAPTEGLCAVGAASVVSGDGPWSWTCAGQDGSDASCLADASCPAATLSFGDCAATVVEGEHGFEDQLTNESEGQVGVVDARCEQGEWVLSGDWCEPVVDGVCGAAEGAETASAPSSGLCVSGVASVVSGSGPWSWTCDGVNGGVGVSCTSFKTCDATMLGWGSCSAAVDVASRGQSVMLGNEVLGYDGSAIATCSAAGDGAWELSETSCDGVVAGVCGAAGGGDTAVAPSSGLCVSGVASVVGGSGPWTWTCAGAFGGADASCTSYKTCAGTTLGWGSCSATTTTATRSQTQSLTNGVGGYQGSATATCSGTGDGSWSLSGAVCNATVNGSCGSANGVGVTSAPSANLCAAGTATSVTGSGPWSWSCTGAYGGTTASCSAPVRVEGVCGSAHGGNTAVAPSTSLCASGSATGVSGTGPWTWSCNGSNGGANASCTSYKTCSGTSLSWSNCSATTTTATRSQTQSLTNGVGGYQGSATATCSGTGDGSWALSSTVCNATVNGACGSANGGNTTSAPTGNLCSAGTPTTVNGSGPYTWSCTGAFGGTTASCSSNRSCTSSTLTWGSCSGSQTAQNHGYSASLSNTTGGWTGSATATCTQGAWSTSSTSCLQIINGACGSHNGADLASPPTNLCTSGTPTTVSGSGPYTWSCTGANTGSTANCTAYKTCAGTSLGWGSCSATTTTASRSQTQSLTNSVGGYQGSATATCSATGNGAWSLSSTVCNQSVNGVCGSANGGSTLTAPTGSLCSSGSPTAVSGSGPYTWSCTGSFGGSTANCSSNRSCDATTLSWGAACSASRSAQAHGFSASLTNATGCYSGSVTSTCSQGTWSLSGPTCSYTCGGGGGGGCFLGTTLILLADGTLKPLEQVQVGDMLQGKTQVNIVTANSAYVVKSPLYRINDSGTAYVTGTHPFYTTDGWKAFDPVGAMTAHWGVLVTQLELGDILIDMEGNEVVLEYFEAEDHGEIVVYNPSLDGDHTYFANGYLMHNQQKQ